ncbi:GMP synthase-like glutamine amidotransferase [Lewinella aquimaris]|uniref:GMP synthase-like glutamine amidotransferase n=1 Tax=Neolewinella aquimaris TaxID=1835722 RepID=A0A840DWZ3_9BACT|nr:GMP synthase [Neolewinella aquimaris]MBB4077460.1 GMP synthase-like glutamine amidotransferase [Neolewinella aquimaris]
MSRLRLAILDLYNGIPNQGMRCIREIAEQYSDRLEYEVFDVRAAHRIPDLSFDLYISSGGPGDPREGDGVWEPMWGEWFDSVRAFNAQNDRKKFVFFICHSFQMAVHHLGLAEVTQRRSLSFGTFPMHITEEGENDPIFTGLADPFTAADFRRFQVVQPDMERMRAIGATVLAIEKDRPHVDLERATMAIRWTPEIIGTQFHPEADAEGMLDHFSSLKIKTEVINEHGLDKWLSLMADLSDPTKIAHTHDAVIPGFIERALEVLSPEPAVARG